MKCRCPQCGHAAELIHFANEEAARQAVYLVAGLPKSLGQLSLRYIGLFKPTERSLSWERTLNLLKPLKADIDAAQITRHGRIWAAPEGLWHKALTSTISQAETGKVKLPLKNHNYLYEIISSEQNSVEAKAEQAIEEKRQQAQHRKSAPEPTKVEQTDEDKAAGEQAMQEVFKQLKAKRKSGGNP